MKSKFDKKRMLNTLKFRKNVVSKLQQPRIIGGKVELEEISQGCD